MRWKTKNTCRWPILLVISVPKIFVNFNLSSKMWSHVFFGTQSIYHDSIMIFSSENMILLIFSIFSKYQPNSTNIRKFYGGLNNIISVIGKKRNEISCVHLVKIYCVPSLLYGCEVWNLSCAEYRHLMWYGIIQLENF